MKERKYIWQAELERIEKLRWWDKVHGVAGLPADPAVYHFHPVGLVANFSGGCTCINIERFIQEYKKQHSSDFGWYEKKGSPKTTLPELNDASENNLRTLLRGIKTCFIDSSGECDIRKIAYMLATSRVESYDFYKGIFFGPINEHISYEKAEIDYGSGQTARRADYARKMGNTEDGDGYKYRGRGLVQLTWKNHYATFADILKIPLVEKPDLAAQWEPALQIMIVGMQKGVFSGHSLSEFISDSTTDYRSARQIINGFDKADIFAEYASKFEILLKETGDS